MVRNNWEPSYQDVVAAAGQATESPVAYPEGKEAPEGTTYAIDPSFTAPEGWTVEIDPATGTVTATVAEAGPNGADVEEIEVPVLVTYPDDAAQDEVVAKFLLDTDGDGEPDVTDEDDDNDGALDEDEAANGTDPKDPNSNQAADNAPDYEDATAKPGESVTVPQTGDTELPDGTAFATEDGWAAPEGWGVVVDPETGDPILPDGTKFEIAPDSNIPDGWTVTIDPETGTVTVVVPSDAAPGTTGTIKVTIVYPDGSKETVDLPVTVHTPSWKDTDAEPGTPTTIPQTGDTSLPPGTKFDIGTSNPDGTITKPTLPEGWSATIDKDTGAITVTPPAGAKPGDTVKIPVTVTYPDGTQQTTEVVVTVPDPDGEGDDEGLTVTFPDDVLVPPGKTVIVKPIITPDEDGSSSTKLPEGTTIVIIHAKLPEGATAHIGPNGELIVTFPKNAPHGDWSVDIEVSIPGRDPYVEHVKLSVDDGGIGGDAPYSRGLKSRLARTGADQLAAVSLSALAATALGLAMRARANRRRD